jgi:serine/threonine protein kinase
LTKFKAQLDKSGGVKDVQGTVQWLAPEVLQETPNIDYALSDVYSFGVILWETLTRDQPYRGLTYVHPLFRCLLFFLSFLLRATLNRPAGVAVAVIRDNLRPPIPSHAPPDYARLVTDCWHMDPTMRPTFLEIMHRLTAMAGSSLTHSSSSSASGSMPAGRDSSSYSSDAARMPWSVLRRTRGTSGDSPISGEYEPGSPGSQSPKGAVSRLDAGAEQAPGGEVAIVFSDMARSATLWGFDPLAMRDATILHNQILRDALQRHGGYEVAAFAFSREGDGDSHLKVGSSGEGSFCLAFQRVEDALEWCMDVQAALLRAPWPESLLSHPAAAAEQADDHQT